MSVFDGDLPKSNGTIASPGEDLYGLSVSELDERIAPHVNRVLQIKAIHHKVRRE